MEDADSDADVNRNDINIDIRRHSHITYFIWLCLLLFFSLGRKEEIQGC